MTKNVPENRNKQMLKVVYLLFLLLLYYLISLLGIWALFSVAVLVSGLLLLFYVKPSDQSVHHKELTSDVHIQDEESVVAVDSHSENIRFLQGELDACRIRESEFQLLLEKLQTGLLIFSQGKLVYTNNYTVKFFKKPVKELLQKSEEELFIGDLSIVIDDKELEEYYIQTSEEGLTHFKIKRAYLDNNSFAYIITEKINPKGTGDIKKHKLEVIGQLANGVAHDFNNTLTGILGAIDLLEDDLDSSKGELISLIRESASRATDLTHKILNFSQKEYVESQNFDIHETILTTISILERTINKKIKISHNLTASTSTIEGSISIVQNMLLNMSLNSEAAMPDGGELQFSTKVTSFNKKECFAQALSIKPGTYIQIIIRDTGEGISEGDIDKIFDPFYTSRDRSKSIGLGLTNAYKDVIAMGGQISVKSSPHEETIFTITLPISISNEQYDEVSIHKTQGKQLLIVDDEKVIRLTAKAILENAGFSVVLAENGVEAIKLYREHNIDLVLMDMIMPEMDGRECLKELKKINSDVKVILVTGFVREKDVIKMKQNGLWDVVTKPFNPKLLTQKISNALDL